MTHVEDITIESDENGWELHLVVGEDITVSDDGRVVLNIHGVSEQLLREVVTKIGPWLLEGMRAAREWTPFSEEEEPSADILEWADHYRKAQRERGA